MIGMSKSRLQRSPILRTVALGAGLTTLWSVIGFLVMPWLVTSAYHGRSLPILNRIISGRDIHPVETYLQLWQRIASDVLWICIAFSIAAIAAEAWRLRHPPQDVPVDMPRRRLVVANCAVASLLLSFLLVHLFVRWGTGGQDPWPLSTFPMYSGLVSDPFSYLRLFLVTPGPDSSRILFDGAAIYPFDRPRLLDNFWAQSRDQREIEGLLEDLRQRYNSRVASGELAGPYAGCVELYTVQLPLKQPTEDPLENLPSAPSASACGVTEAP